MDSSVITEIASQLGMAVESTGQFIEEILPQYATMKIIEGCFALAATLIVLVVALAFVVKAIRSEARHKAEYEKDKELRKDSFWGVGHYSWYEANFTCALCGSLVSVASFITIAISMTATVQWAVTPQAKFFAMVLEKVAS